MTESSKYANLIGTPLSQAYQQQPTTFQQMEVPREAIEKQEILGKGHFGNVWKALFNGVIVVALKELHVANRTRLLSRREAFYPNVAHFNDQQQFIQEARTMFELNHPKIVQLFGVCVDQEPFYILMEYLPNGALSDYLKNFGPEIVSFSNLLDIIAQVLISI